jgi:hypothetical protein
VPSEPGHVLLPIDQMAYTELRGYAVVSEGDEEHRPILDALPGL